MPVQNSTVHAHLMLRLHTLNRPIALRKKGNTIMLGFVLKALEIDAVLNPQAASVTVRKMIGNKKLEELLNKVLREPLRMSNNAASDSDIKKRSSKFTTVKSEDEEALVIEFSEAEIDFLCYNIIGFDAEDVKRVLESYRNNIKQAYRQKDLSKALNCNSGFELILY